MIQLVVALSGRHFVRAVDSASVSQNCEKCVKIARPSTPPFIR